MSTDTTDTTAPAGEDGSWTSIGAGVIPPERRAAFLAKVQRLDWVDPDGTHPMSPALALKALVGEFNIQPVIAIAYNLGWTVPDGPETATYTILGVSTRKQRIIAVDGGVSLTPIVVLDGAATLPDVPAVTAPRGLPAPQAPKVRDRLISYRFGGEGDGVHLRVMHNKDRKLFYASLNEVTLKTDGSTVSEQESLMDSFTIHSQPAPRYSAKQLAAYAEEVLAGLPDLLAPEREWPSSREAERAAALLAAIKATAN